MRFLEHQIFIHLNRRWGRNRVRIFITFVCCTAIIQTALYCVHFKFRLQAHSGEDVSPSHVWGTYYPGLFMDVCEYYVCKDDFAPLRFAFPKKMRANAGCNNYSRRLQCSRFPRRVCILTRFFAEMWLGAGSKLRATEQNAHCHKD